MQTGPDDGGAEGIAVVVPEIPLGVGDGVAVGISPVGGGVGVAGDGVVVTVGVADAVAVVEGRGADVLDGAVVDVGGGGTGVDFLTMGRGWRKRGGIAGGREKGVAAEGACSIVWAGVVGPNVGVGVVFDGFVLDGSGFGTATASPDGDAFGDCPDWDAGAPACCDASTKARAIAVVLATTPTATAPARHQELRPH